MPICETTFHLFGPILKPFISLLEHYRATSVIIWPVSTKKRGAESRDESPAQNEFLKWRASSL